MLYDEYNLDEHLECRYEDGFEDGTEKGIEIGTEKGIEIGTEKGIEQERKYIIDLINQGLSTDEIKQLLENTSSLRNNR